MTTTVMNIYQKCLKEKTECSNNTKLSGSDYFGMNNEDHLKRISADITFIPIYIQENNFKMFVVGSSHNKIEPLDELESTLNKNLELEAQVKTFCSCFEDSINNNKEEMK
ncbi:718_t:CDS:2, partial [Entrophospora sp. SA101]